MPSTVAHALTTVGTGVALHAFSHGRFRALHVVLLVLHATNGPDIGSVFEFLMQPMNPTLGTRFMDVVHSPLGYPLTAGLGWVWVGMWLSRRDLVFGRKGWRDFSIVMRREDDDDDESRERQRRRRRRWQRQRRRGQGRGPSPALLADGSDIGLTEAGAGAADAAVNAAENDEERPPDAATDEGDDDVEDDDNELDVERDPTSLPLTFWRSWCLALAGSLLHYRLDTLYENNGQTPTYRWIISTGYWLPGANDIIYPSVTLAFLLTLSTLIATFAITFTSLRTTLPLPRPVASLLRTRPGRIWAVAGVAMVLSVAYCVFFWTRLRIEPRVPAVGEEADLGVLMFEAATTVLPLVLCGVACGQLF
ncbi:hypothetical protein HDU88_005870 [Geranomyces variabilis]|nr:hypothetical protein HDU88_005870 [Geranomyces variabilis]